MSNFRCEWHGLEETRKWLDFIKEQIDGGSQAYDDLEEDAKQIIITRTTSAGIDVSGKKFKTKKDGSASYLRKAGNMIAGLVSWRSGNQITISHDDPVYGAVHNFGGISGRGKHFRMPQREWFGLMKADMAKLNEKLLKTLNDVFTRMMPR